MILSFQKGLKYFFECELNCMNKLKAIKYINLIEYLRNVILKFLLRIISNDFRNWIYKTFLRRNVNG